MNETEPNDEQVAGGGLSAADMAASLYPIYERPDVMQNPEAVSQYFTSVWESGEGQWDQEAEDLFSRKFDEYKRASKTQLGILDNEAIAGNFYQSLPQPEISEEWEPEKQEEALNEWKAGTLSQLAIDKTPDWVLHKNEITEFLDSQVAGKVRQIKGKDVGPVRDALARFGQGGGTYIASILGADATAEDIAAWFNENPEYDESWWAKVPEALGQGAVQLGAPAAAAVGVGALATAASAPVAVAAGAATLTWVGLQSLFSLGSAYNNTYDNVYRETGSVNSAQNAAIKNAVSAATVETAIDTFTKSKLISPVFKGVNTARKSRLLGGMIEFSKKAPLFAAAEGATGGLQSAAQQAIEQPYTGKAISGAQIAEDAALEAIAGGVIGGGISGVSAGINRNVIEPQPAPVEPEAPQLGLPAPEVRLGLPAPAPVSNRDFALRMEDTALSSEVETGISPLYPLSDAQLEQLGSEVDKFADSDETSLTIKGVLVSQIPQELLDLTNTAVKQTSDGVEITKVPVIKVPLNTKPYQAPIEEATQPTPVEVTPEVEVEITEPPSPQEIPLAVSEETIQGFENRINSLNARLKEIDVKSLEDRIQWNIDQIKKAQMAFGKVKNEVGVKRIKDQITNLKRKLQEDQFLYQRELKTGVLSREKAAIQKELKALNTNLAAAQSGYTPVRAYGTRGPMTKSKYTKASFAAPVNTNLRDLINYSLASFNVDVPEILVTDAASVEQGNIGDYPAKHKENVAGLYSKMKEENARAASAVTKNGKFGAIVMEDTSFTPETAVEASHEASHIIMKTFEKAPQEVQEQIKADYWDAATKARRYAQANDVARYLGHPTRQKEGTLFSQLPPDDQEYYAGPEVGYKEWFANQVAYFLTNPDYLPKNKGEMYIQTIAQGFNNTWGNLNRAFPEQSPTLRKWLKDTFQAIPEDEFPSADFVKNPSKIEPKIPSGMKEHKLSARLRRDPKIAEEVRAGISGDVYTTQNAQETISSIERNISKESIDRDINTVLNDSNNLGDDFRGAYAIATLKKLREYERSAETPEGKTLYQDKQVDFITKLNDLALEKGRFINYLKWASEVTGATFSKVVNKQLEAIFEKAGVDAPENLRVTINKITKEFHPLLSKQAEGSFLYNEVLRQMYDRISKEVELPPANLWTYLWYGNILSGYDTQAVNALSNGVNLALRSASLAISNPKDAPAVMRGLLNGAVKGLTKAKATFKGRPIKNSSGNKFGFYNSLVAPQVKWQNRTLSVPLNKLARLLQYFPFRALSAMDTMMAETASQAMAHVVASKNVRRALKDNELASNPGEFARRMNEELHNSKKELEDIRKQAEKEVKEVFGPNATENDVDLRVMEIVDSRRAPELNAEAARFGNIITYMNRPEGMFGKISNALDELGDKATLGKVPVLRMAVFPFTKVVANVLSSSLDFTPLGLVRAWKGNNIFAKGDDSWSDIERKHRATASILGTAGASVLFAMAANELDKEDPAIAFFAEGPPPNSRERATWLAKGNLPYSMRIGDKVVKFAEMPIGPLLSVIGTLHDLDRYSKRYDRESAYKKATMAIQGIGKGIIDTGFLSSIKNIFDVFDGKKSPDTLVAQPLKGFIPFQGAMRSINKFIHPDKLDYKDANAAWLSGLPVAQSFVRPSLNAFGEPIQQSGRFLNTLTDDPVWKWVSNNNLTLPGMPSNIIGTGRSNEEKRFYAAILGKRKEDVGRFAYNTLTEEELFKIVERSGPRIKSRISNLLELQNIPTETLQKAVDSIVNEERRLAKMSVLMDSYRLR